MYGLAFARTHVAARALRPAFASQRQPPFYIPVRYNSSQSKVEPFWDAPKISYDQVKPRTEQPSPNAYIIDVREPDEVILGSIPSTVNLPLSIFAESLHLNPVAFKEKHGFEKPKRDQEVIFYCRSGKRSATAADIAKKQGYTNILNYEGSWLDWTSKEQGKSSFDAFHVALLMCFVLLGGWYGVEDLERKKLALCGMLAVFPFPPLCQLGNSTKISCPEGPAVHGPIYESRRMYRRQPVAKKLSIKPSVHQISSRADVKKFFFVSFVAPSAQTGSKVDSGEFEHKNCLKCPLVEGLSTPSLTHCSRVMAFKSVVLLAFLVTYVSGHYQVSYPEPRGPYVSDQETQFCDGYTNAASTRDDFPLSNGFVKLNNSHEEFSASVLISIEQNPSNFSVFNTSTTGVQLPYAVDWFSGTGAGEICIPVNVASLNISGVGDGSNVTLQTMVAGSHGNLFQCVDVTLRANATVPSNVTCSRTINSTLDTAPSSTSTSTSSEGSSGGERLIAGGSGILGFALALLLV